MTAPFSAQYRRARAVVFRGFAAGLRPADDISIAEWSEKYVDLRPPEAEPGPYRVSRTPYIAGPMEWAGPYSRARYIVLMAGTQIGKTRFLLNVIGHRAHQAPTNMILALPGEAIAKEWSHDRLSRLFELPVLAPLLSDHADRKTTVNSWQLKKIRGGGTIKMAWSTSPVSMKSTSAELVFSDEVDSFDDAAAKRWGDPIQLLNDRLQNYPRGKHFMVSSPTRGDSPIYKQFLRGDQRYYFVPCPACGHFQRLVWERFTWENDDPSTVAYTCSSCSERILERNKTRMLAEGRWVATADHPMLAEEGFSAEDLPAMEPIFEAMIAEKFISASISGLYSPLGWLSWTECAETWIKTESDSTARKAFINSKLAEVWSEKGDTPDHQMLKAKAEDYPIGTVPVGGRVLIAYVDIQKRYFEYEVAAWGPGMERWSVEYGTIGYGPDDPKAWEALDQLLARDFPCADGGSLPIRLMGIDSGHRAEEVYAYVRRHRQPWHGPAGTTVVGDRVVVATKGHASFQKVVKSVSPDSAAARRGGVKIFEVGTGLLKVQVYDNIRKDRNADGTFPQGYYHFPRYGDAYWPGVCSESLVEKNGKPAFVKDPKARNEPLDCLVGTAFCAYLVGLPQWPPERWQQEAARTQAPAAAPADLKKALAPIAAVEDPYLG